MAAGPPSNASRCSLAACATSSSPPPAALWGSRPPAWHKEGFMWLDGPGGCGGQREVGRMTPGRGAGSSETQPPTRDTWRGSCPSPESSKPTQSPPHRAPGRRPCGVGLTSGVQAAETPPLLPEPHPGVPPPKIDPEVLHLEVTWVSSQGGGITGGFYFLPCADLDFLIFSNFQQ